MCHRIGRPPISIIGVGWNSVAPRSRVPNPPHSTTTFMYRVLAALRIFRDLHGPQVSYPTRGQGRKNYESHQDAGIGGVKRTRSARQLANLANRRPRREITLRRLPSLPVRTAREPQPAWER